MMAENWCVIRLPSLMALKTNFGYGLEPEKASIKLIIAYQHFKTKKGRSKVLWMNQQWRN